MSSKSIHDETIRPQTNDLERESSDLERQIISPTSSNRHLYESPPIDRDFRSKRGNMNTNERQRINRKIPDHSESKSFQIFKKAAGLLPLLFVLGALCWVYYVYMFVLSIPSLTYGERFWVQLSQNKTFSGTAESGPITPPEPIWVRREGKPSGAYVAGRITLMIFFHVFYLLLVWSYYKVVTSDPGTIPRSFDSKYTSETKSDGSNIRECWKCENIKPDRAHHCSACKKCIRKMDHHCPWVNNCVGWGNYKYFLLFLFWLSVTGLYIVCSTVSWVIENGLSGKIDGKLIQIPVLLIFCGIFGLGMVAFVGTHIRLVLINQTTIESFEKRRRRRKRVPGQEDAYEVESHQDVRNYNPYDLGAKRNFCSVFGNNPILWLLPVHSTPGDGIIFETVDEENDRLLV